MGASNNSIWNDNEGFFLVGFLEISKHESN